eukprot:g2829.t1
MSTAPPGPGPAQSGDHLAGSWKPASSKSLGQGQGGPNGPNVPDGRPQMLMKSVEFDANDLVPLSSIPQAPVYLPNARRPFGPNGSQRKVGDLVTTEPGAVPRQDNRSGAGRPADGGAQQMAAALAALGDGAPTQYRILDGFLLLDACRVEMPDEATRADLQCMDIEGVTEEDMSFFQNLAFVDLGENSVPLEQLRTLPGLQELRLHCNSVRDVGGIGPDGFPKLEVLDLSYNMLETDAIGRLAQLPRLRRLDLTCNELTTLPRNLVRRPAAMRGDGGQKGTSSSYRRAGSEGRAE